MSRLGTSVNLRRIRMTFVVLVFRGLAGTGRFRYSVRFRAGARQLVMTPTSADPLVLPLLINVSILFVLRVRLTLPKIWPGLQVRVTLLS